MIKKPIIRSSLHVSIVEPDFVFLLNEYQNHVLKGAVYTRVVPLMDGTHTTDNIISMLGPELPMAKMLYAFDHMEEKGYIVEADGCPVESNDEASFWDMCGASMATVKKRMKTCTVSVKSFGNVNPSVFTAELESAGVRIAPRGGDISVIIVDDYLKPELKAMNQHALDTDSPWLLVKPIGMQLWIGPLFRPGITGCWDCLAQRLKANRQVEQYISRNTQDSSSSIITSKAVLPATESIATGMASVELAKFLVTGRSLSLEGKIITIDVLSMDQREHVLIKRPQCTVCGPQEDQWPLPPSRIALQSRIKKFTIEGGHRTATPEETLERFKHHISPVTGVVSTLERLSEEDNNLINTYTAGHNFAMIRDSLFFLNLNLRGRSGGKGATDVQAKVSGLCEAIERYSGIEPMTELVHGSYNDLKSQGAVHPYELMLFSDKQYENREGWNQSLPETQYHVVPCLFDDNRAIDWVQATSLTNDCLKLVPASYCYYGKMDDGPFSIMSDSNGCAAGNTLEEAILQGCMELIERDCVALWWYNMINRRGVDLDSFNLPYINELQEYYTGINRNFWVLDITADMGVPTFVGVSGRTDNKVEDIVIGFGAHFDPKIALLRAATEVNQFLPAVTRRNPDGSTKYWFPDKEAIVWWKTATMENQPYLKPKTDEAAIKFSDFPVISTDDIKADIEKCVAVAKKNGIEVLALDQTQPDVELSVVKVMMPGLTHYWRRLGSPRLYNLPIQYKWLKTPRAEEEMNPISIFF